MKALFLIVVFWLACGCPVFSQQTGVASGQFRIEKQTSREIVFSLQPFDLSLISLTAGNRTYQRVRVADFGVWQKPGFPELPQTAAVLELPPGTEATVSVLASRFEDMADIMVSPAPSFFDNTSSAAAAYRFDEDAAAYASDAFWPQKIVQVGGEGRLRGKRVLRILVNPVQWNPVQKKLRVFRSLTVRIRFSKPVVAGKVPNLRRPGGAVQKFRRRLLLSAPEPVSPARRAAAPNHWLDAGQTYMKLTVRRDGIYAVSFEELVQAGANAGSWPLAQVALFNRGQAVPIHIDGPQGAFLQPGNVIYFYGEHNRPPDALYDFYSDDNVYWLTAADEPGKRYREMAEIPAAPAQDFYYHTLHLEQENIFHRSNGTTAIDGDEGWIWRYLFPDQHAIFNFDISGLQKQVELCSLRVRLHGTTSDPVSPDHHVTVVLNDVQVAEAFFDEKQERIVQAAFASGVLRNGQNKFDLHLVPDTGAEVNQIYLDWVEIVFPRAFAAESGALVFGTQKSGGTGTFSLFNFPDAGVRIFSPGRAKIWLSAAQQRSVFRVTSAGFDDGSFVEMDFDLQHFRYVSRGYHLLRQNSETGELEEHNFDVFGSADQATAMADFIDQLPQNTVVLAGVSDEGSVNMNEAAFQALESLGSRHIRELGFRDSWALVGWKGAPVGAASERLVKRFGGGAVVDTVLQDNPAFHYSVVFQDTLSAGQRYVAVSDSGVRRVARIVPDVPSDLMSDSNGADYIVITHADFRAQAQQLADYRAQHDGFRTLVVDVQDIYDEFNFGIRHPQAIRDFLRFAFQNYQPPAPAFVVLFGDASWDPEKRMSDSVKENFVPSYGILVSDSWLVSLDGPDDILPDMFVGRLPVETAEQAQTVVQKIMAYEQLPFAKWNKEFMFMDGGINSTEQSIFLSQASNLIQRFIQVSPFHGEALQFNKTTNEAITQNLRREAARRINSGVAWVNFLGHAGSAVWDIDIGQPDEWQNSEVFPFITGMSCHSARFANPINNSLSEAFFVNPIGACGYWGSSGFGFITQDFFLLEGLFKAVTLDTVRTIGEATTLAKWHLWQVLGDESRNRRTINQYVLMGDPALHLVMPEKPELAVRPEDVSFASDLLLLSDSSTVISGTVANYGYLPQDSVSVSFASQGDQGSSPIASVTVPPFGNEDSVEVAWRFPPSPGEYRIQVLADAGDRIDEADENNNLAQVTVNVFASDLTLIKPPAFAVVKTGTPQLVTSNSRSSLPDLRYEFEIDTVATFDSPARQRSGRLPEGQLVTAWQPQLPAPGVYHWRVRTVSGEEPGPWDGASFTFQPQGQGAWQQSDSVQFSANTLQGTEVAADGTVGLKQNRTVFEVQSAGLLDGNFTLIFVNDQGVSQSARGHNLAVFDERDGAFLEFRHFDTWADAANAEAMAQFISAIPTGRIVAAGITDDGTGSMTESAYAALESIGSQFTRQVGFRDSWAIVGRKGAAVGTVPEVWKRSGEGPAAVKDTLVWFGRSGVLQSVAIGPARQWRTAAFDFVNAPGSGSVAFSVLGKERVAGRTDTLFKSIADVATLDLQAVDASRYPEIRLLADFTSATGKESPRLRQWRVDFDGAPDLVLGRRSVVPASDTLLVGNDAVLNVEYGNFGVAAADSFALGVQARSADGLKTISRTVALAGLAANSTRQTQVLLPTAELSGGVTTSVALDPANDLVEINESNNAASVTFHVVSDTVAPQVRITIDGRDVGTGDFVTARPEVVVEIHEQAPWSLADTARVSLFLDAERVGFGTAAGEAEFVPQVDPPGDLRALVFFRPQLSEGEHRLEVLVKDVSENVDYQERQFVVSSEFLIANVMNYPNPFAESTEFTYVLTQPADEVRIKIYTVAGRLIRELEFAPANVGFNALRWNGRDHDKDPLANGVYLYKIIARQGDRQVEFVDRFVVMR